MSIRTLFVCALIGFCASFSAHAEDPLAVTGFKSSKIYLFDDNGKSRVLTKEDFLKGYAPKTLPIPVLNRNQKKGLLQIQYGEEKLWVGADVVILNELAHTDINCKAAPAVAATHSQRSDAVQGGVNGIGSCATR